MLKDLENNFSVLEKKILNVTKNYQNLTEQYLESVSYTHLDVYKRQF